MNPETKYYVALNQSLLVGSATFQKLLKRHKSLKKVWEGADLFGLGISPKTIGEIRRVRQTIDPDREMEKLKLLDISVVILGDKNYPKLLSEIPDPPALLYYKGQLVPDEVAVAVVGSRKFSSYGESVTEEIVEPLSQAGVTIVSGLALGIDAIAHRVALEAKGRTVGVLGCGLDRVYPVSNQQLAKRIIQSDGAIVSEYPLGTPAYPSHFPVRNRIIAGLSLGTLVVEAAVESGSLLTARSALDYNRQVFAVPGDIHRPTSIGPNNLIKIGAKSITEADEILTELNLKVKTKQQKARAILPSSKEEAILLEHLSQEPIYVDKLKGLSKLETSTVTATLVLMEMKGMVKNLGGGLYVKS